MNGSELLDRLRKGEGQFRGRVAALALVAFLAACSSQNTPLPPMMPGSSASGMPGMPHDTLPRTDISPSIPPDAQRVEVVGTEFAFSPSDPRIQADSPTAITFKNDGTTAHDWTVHQADGTEIAHAHAEAGETATVVMRFEPGTYDVWCTIAGHKEAGMVGTLTAA